MSISNSIKEIPEIVMLYNDQTYHGVQGSRCWEDLCVDYGIPAMRTDFKEKVKINYGSTISFKVIGYKKPEKFQVTIFSGNKIVSDTSVENKLLLQMDRQDYFLVVQTHWAKGDVSNVFSIMLE